LPALARGDDLGSLVTQALSENREVAAAERKWQASAQRAGQATSLPDPLLGADVERAGTTDFSDYHDIEYMVQQDLPGWGKRKARATVAQLDAEAEGFRYLETARSVRGRVVGAYWDLWLAQRNVGLAKEARDLMARMEQSALARYETGQAMQTEVLRLQVEAARMSNEVISMERELGVARTALNSLLNAPPGTPRAVEGDPALPVLAGSLTDMQQRARRFCCILLSFLRARDARAAALRAAKVERRPDWQVRVEARQFEESGSIEEYDTALFVNIPWLWRGKYGAMIREAQAKVDVADADYENEVNRTMLEIQELYTRTENAERAMRLNRDTLLPRARSLIESAVAAYQTGQSPLLEFLEAQKTRLDIEREAVRSQAEFARSHAELSVIAAPWGEFEIGTGLVSAEMNNE
jgi:cobalt-zinc-cadmium efflux system outer membrane protein